MQFVAQSVPGEITLMFVSYLLFCSVLMYLFIKTDREWGRLEASIELPGNAKPQFHYAAIAASAPASGDRRANVSAHDEFIRKSLDDCLKNHDVTCTCFLSVQRESN